MGKEMTCGKVWLVGAGVGDIGLLSRKGMEVLQAADVVVFDALVSLELLARLPENAELINAGKRSSHHLIPQENINQILLEKAKDGKNVVRLKGGDPFVFGRGGEELELLVKENIPFEVVPGITSSIAVPAYNGIPVTHRDYTSSFHVITGHKKKDGELDINFQALVDMDATLVFLMGVSALETICNRLMECGMDIDMPAAILEKGTTCRQRRVVATVSTLKKEADLAKIKSPAVIVIGKVCTLSEQFSWVEKKPLFGKQVMITRPQNRMSYLAKKLRKLGAQVIELPTIRTVPVCEWEDSSYYADFQNAVARFVDCKGKVCVSFTSPQGVNHFFTQLRQMNMDLRTLFANPEIKFAVIGQGTKRELEKYGIFADYVPAEYCAKAMGELLAEKLTKDTKVFLFRAKEASDDLPEALKQAGLAYYEVPTYCTVYTKKTAVLEKMEQAFEEGEIDVVMFTSASTVKGFIHKFPDVDYTKISAICIGKQTAKEAEKYHMNITISKEATMDSMVDIMLESEV